ncbi:PAS domain-containing sensor histidine kinase [Gemmatimonas groenlandica]|uniref:PAS domain-containing protein n=1 Tax=Gemmatimonas groenlandica TaxID=2732249 RepID=A0A6M4IGU2_9BACT|nr:PAS domain-containing protein [Gemmatimonas groenlandica]QJR34053.1 PAS domain-containing protein [Gemmatimonas groenlandica]
MDQSYARSKVPMSVPNIAVPPLRTRLSRTGEPAGFGGVVAAAAWHRRAEATRHDHELRALTDNAPDVIIRFDRELRIRYVNRIVEQYTGLSPAMLLGRRVGQLGLSEQNVREWEQGLADVLRTGIAGSMEFTFASPSGPRHFESRFVPEWSRDGTMQFLLGITRDVTERRQAEDAFRRSEAFLAVGQRITRTGSWSRNRLTGAVTWSDEHYRIFEVEPASTRPWSADAVREIFRDRVHPADRALVEDAIGLAIRDMTPLSLEYRLLLRDGSVKHLRSEGGQVSGDEYIGTTMDVTAERHAQEELRRSEAYLAEAQRLSHTGSWAWKIPGREIFWSREMFCIYGFDPADGTPSYEAVLGRAHPDDASIVHQALLLAFSAGTELRLLTRILVPGERMKWVETYGHPVRDEDGRLVEFVGTVVDVTERRVADRRLRRSRKARYEAVIAERTRIARDLHDGLLQDFTGVALQLEALALHARAVPTLSARFQELLQMTQHVGRKARLALHGMRSHRAYADLVAAVHDAAQRLSAPAELALHMRVSGQPRLVPEHVRDAAVSIVAEAMTNVVKHARAGTIRLSVAFGETHLRLSLRDDGCGLSVPGESRERARHFGLVGMRERAATIGAAFSTSSAPGRGTKISIEVPLRREQTAP